MLPPHPETRTDSNAKYTLVLAHGPYSNPRAETEPVFFSQQPYRGLIHILHQSPVQSIHIRGFRAIAKAGHPPPVGRRTFSLQEATLCPVTVTPNPSMSPLPPTILGDPHLCSVSTDVPALDTSQKCNPRTRCLGCLALRSSSFLCTSQIPVQLTCNAASVSEGRHDDTTPAR